MPSCHSTNDISAELISKGDVVNGTVVITDHQKGGRGQGSNTWASEKGANLTLSIILETSFLPVNNQFYLNMMVCLSLTDLLTEYLSSGVSIKWPNDIYYGDEKICGVLIQNVLRGNYLEYSILGLGININQQKFDIENAISLNLVTGRWYDLEQVLLRLLEIVEDYYIILKEGFYGKLKGVYMNRLKWLNEDHTFEAEKVFEGRITDIDEAGRLMISSEDGSRAFNFKEVKFIK